MEMEDVDVVEAEPAQRRLHLAGHRLAGIACVEDGLGRDHQLGAVIGPDGGADDLLGAIGLGGVEEIDSEIDGRAHDRHAVVDAGAAAQAQAAVAAAPEPGDADREAGFSERPVFHYRSFTPRSWRLPWRGRAATPARHRPTSRRDPARSAPLHKAARATRRRSAAPIGAVHVGAGHRQLGSDQEAGQPCRPFGALLEAQELRGAQPEQRGGQGSGCRQRRRQALAEGRAVGRGRTGCFDGVGEDAVPGDHREQLTGHLGQNSTMRPASIPSICCGCRGCRRGR